AGKQHCVGESVLFHCKLLGVLIHKTVFFGNQPNVPMLPGSLVTPITLQAQDCQYNAFDAGTPTWSQSMVNNPCSVRASVAIPDCVGAIIGSFSCNTIEKSSGWHELLIPALSD